MDSTVLVSDGTRLSVTTWGDPGNECIVLVNGLGATKTAWVGEFPGLLHKVLLLPKF